MPGYSKTVLEYHQEAVKLLKEGSLKEAEALASGVFRLILILTSGGFKYSFSNTTASSSSPALITATPVVSALKLGLSAKLRQMH